LNRKAAIVAWLIDGAVAARSSTYEDQVGLRFHRTRQPMGQRWQQNCAPLIGVFMQ
jgi:hypothetical protein